MPEEDLLITEDSGVLVCTLNRPLKLNPINSGMIETLRAAVAAYAGRRDLGCFLIRSTGRYFSAGADQFAGREEMAGSGRTGLERKSSAEVREWYRDNMMGGMHRLYDEMEAIEKPFVAAHHATCLGGGLEMSLSCDFRLAAQSASYGLPESRQGSIPASGGVSRLTRLVGPQWAKWMIIGGQMVDAETARMIGLVQAVYPDAEFEQSVMDFCRRLSAQPREMVSMAKLAIDLCTDSDPRSARMVERLGQSILQIGSEHADLHAALLRRLSKSE